MTWLWIALIVLFLIGVVLNAIDGLKAQDKWLEARQQKKIGTPRQSPNTEKFKR